MPNRHMKEFSTLPIIKKNSLKTSEYHLTSVRTATIANKQTKRQKVNAYKGVRKGKACTLLMGM